MEKSNTYHILNGDALKDRFPATIEGHIIVARECLVDGDVSGQNLGEFFDHRAHLLSTEYKACTAEEYYQSTVAEFAKIMALPSAAEVHLWFEDDLFCQVNLWFVVYLLYQSEIDCSVFLVRPETHNQYGFGGLTDTELIDALGNKTNISNIELWAALWISYQQKDVERLLNTAKQLDDFPFVLAAVEAHLARIPTAETPGRPTQSLIKIMNELGAVGFGPVFQAFSKQESIYGFGDLQVKRLYDQILENREAK